MNDLEQLVSTVKTRIDLFNRRSAVVRAAREERVREAVVTNRDVEPTLDGHSRYHAPCDNYLWTWVEVNSDGDVEAVFDGVFMAGEFLPEDKKMKLFISDYSFSYDNSPIRRVTNVPVDHAKAVIEALSGIVSISLGKIFEGRFGDQVYVYVDARCEDIADVVEAYLDAPRLEAAAAAKTIEEAEYAAAEPCPAGRTQITGEILSTKLQQDFYGSTLKMLLKDDRGFKVWGSVAASLEQPQRGDRVTFMATITPSDDDTKFGFFKRPTKAVYLNEAAA
tara:strand:+ start:104 stop:937 length:834 start_codon:yes stop_codon:yes gene_type:complete